MAEVRGESLTIDWQWPEQKSGEQEKNQKMKSGGQKTSIRVQFQRAIKKSEFRGLEKQKLEIRGQEKTNQG